mmetsp:Transcript_59942/g.147367  ORF Transcript_59942/g.147367 Transcript_59942/m.147367 type:complete len:237 (+) Transcript_59942:759-1469(+)
MPQDNASNQSNAPVDSSPSLGPDPHAKRVVEAGRLGEGGALAEPDGLVALDRAHSHRPPRPRPARVPWHSVEVVHRHEPVGRAASAPALARAGGVDLVAHPGAGHAAVEAVPVVDAVPVLDRVHVAPVRGARPVLSRLDVVGCLPLDVPMGSAVLGPVEEGEVCLGELGVKGRHARAVPRGRDPVETVGDPVDGEATRALARAVDPPAAAGVEVLVLVAVGELEHDAPRVLLHLLG